MSSSRSTVKNIVSVFPPMSSEENSPERPRNSGNNLANNMILERNLKSGKEAVQRHCKQLFRKFDEKLQKIWEKERQTGLLIDTAIKQVDKSFAEEKVLFKEVEKAADVCVSADLNYIKKSKKFLMANKKNKRKLGQLIETLADQQEDAPPHKVRKM